MSGVRSFLRRDELRHIIRAAARILNDPNIVVIGSQSILAAYPEATLPAELLMSIEADLLPLGGDDDAIGEGSAFHEEFGIYGQGVSLETAVLPAGWRDRLVPLTDALTGAIGWCLEPHDLCAAKLVAGREKDLDYVEAAAVHRLVDPVLVVERLAGISDTRRELAIARATRFRASGIADSERTKWRRRREMALAQRRAKAPSADWPGNRLP
jgi:hypothetical protein